MSRPVQTRINERIRIREVRLIDENGEQVGVIPTFDALQMARERGLDLVEVAPNAMPPVCRLMDYGK
ncbi:MAG TPA: translation initiation factor IF-3, partial [Thermomicrobiales bacterium]|nr:translation initiation factor IF-3 [Thermomicrobiales bacterium]